MKRNTYLKTTTLEEAMAIFKSKNESGFIHSVEEIDVTHAFGRVTAEPIYAKVSNPHFNAAAMDGIMVDSQKTLGANERHPIRLLKGIDFEYVDTGDLINPLYDSVIKIEDLIEIDEKHVEIREPSHPWEHIRMAGEDFVLGDMLMTRNHQLSAVDLGALVSGGLSHIPVYKQAKVGIIPTGSEIVEIGTRLKPGDILESNSRMFSALIVESGGIPNRYPIVPDDPEKLRRAILKAVTENDILIINAGSSAGREDYTATLMRELGEIWLHGIDIKPGKPTLLGAIRGVPVIGIPGYPVSAYMAFKHFVLPLICPVEKNLKTIQVTLSQDIPSSLKHKEFVRVQLGRVGEKLMATPLTRGAASTLSLVKANGILTIDKESEGFRAGEQVRVESIREHKAVDRGLLAVGSHDIVMDWIADALLKMKKSTFLISSHVGSFGGIMALKRGEAHLAPIHLLDEKTGIYNESYIQKYLSGEKWFLIKGIKRWQGLYSRAEEDKVEKFEDIIKRKMIFINRQKGSGTRLLTDHLLLQKGFSQSDVLGYQTEVFTHTAVALAVLNGNADVGVGIESVAKKMGLNYTPLAKEDYDFLLPQSIIHLDLIKDFIDVLKSDDFQNHLKKVGGYEIGPIKWVEIGGE